MNNDDLVFALFLMGIVAFFVCFFWSIFLAKRIATKFLEHNRPLAHGLKTRLRQTRLIFKACADYNFQWGWHFSAKLPDEEEIWLFVAMFPTWLPDYGVAGFGKRMIVEFRPDKDPEIVEQQLSLQLGGKLISVGKKTLKELFQMAVIKHVVVSKTGEICWSQTRIWREDGSELREIAEAQT